MFLKEIGDELRECRINLVCETHRTKHALFENLHIKD